MFAQLQIPQNAVWYDAVQVVLLVGAYVAIGILVKMWFSLNGQREDLSDRIIKLEAAKDTNDKALKYLADEIKEQRKDFASLEKTVTNCYAHRFEQLARTLGIEKWDDK